MVSNLLEECDKLATIRFLSLKDLKQKGICKPVVSKAWLDWRLTVGDGAPRPKKPDRPTGRMSSENCMLDVSFGGQKPAFRECPLLAHGGCADERLRHHKVTWISSASDAFVRRSPAQSELNSMMTVIVVARFFLLLPAPRRCRFAQGQNGK